MKSELERELERFRQELLRRERAAASAMVRVYGAAWRRIQDELDRLDTEYLAAKTRGEKPGPEWIYQYNRARAFRDQVERELNEFSRYAESSTREQMAAAIRAAEEHAEHLTRAALGKPPHGITIPWNRISTAAVEQAVGLTQPESPLHQLLLSIGGEGAQAAEDALINGVLMGLNPRKTARFVRQALGTTLSRALRISRTETLRAYRESTRQSFLANGDVLEGWVWSAKLDTRTCAMCVAGETTVSGPSIQKVFSRYYSGDIAIIKTAGGKHLTVTPNHPILTGSGWVKAGLLKKGDYVISSIDTDGASLGIGIDNYQMPTLIEQIAESFGMVSAEMPCSSPDFHGDGEGSDVYVIRSNGLLTNNFKSTVFECLREKFLGARISGKATLRSLFFPFFRSFYTLFKGSFIWSRMIGKNRFTFFQRNSCASCSDGFSKCPSWCIGKAQTNRYRMSVYTEGFGEFLLGLSGKISGSNLVFRKIQLAMTKIAILLSGNRIALRFISEQATLFQNISQSLAANTEARSNFLGGFAGKVCLDRILDIDIRSFSGHVYNLQTHDGWYFANGIITHNCWAMHGTVHKLEERLEDHPNGRCGMEPLTKTWAEIGRRIGIDLSDIEETRLLPEPGADVFSKLSQTEQINILGPAKWAAWKENKFSFSDLAGRKFDPVWGWMRYERSLTELIGSDAAKGYTRLALMGVAQRAGKYSVGDLIRVAGLGLRELTPEELKRIVQHVAKAGFDPNGLEKCGGRLVGLVWNGKTLKGSDLLPPGEAHYLRHVVYGHEWPANTTLNEYYQSLREVIEDENSGIVVHKIGSEWQIGFLNKSSEWRGLAGNDIIFVDYRLSISHWVTGYQPDDFESQLASSKWSNIKWLRPFKIK